MICKKIKNILYLTEKILKTKKDTIKSKNDNKLLFKY